MGMTSAATPTTAPAATARSASRLPKVSRTVPTPTERYDQSSTALNCRLKKMKKPRSKNLTSTSTPTASPIAQLKARPARPGRATARATMTSPSSGSRAKKPGVSCHGRIGATRAAQTTRRASKVRPAVTRGRGERAAVARAGASSRCRQSHQTSRPNDSASNPNATTSRTRLAHSGGTPEAATTSAIPCAAVTVLRQSRRGSGARSHGNAQPAAKKR